MAMIRSAIPLTSTNLDVSVYDICQVREKNVPFVVELRGAKDGADESGTAIGQLESDLGEV
jgi:hypothetical protein